MNINLEAVAVFLIVGMALFFLLHNWLAGNKKKCCGEKCGSVLPVRHKADSALCETKVVV